jgi:ADP-ribose pyrophosphatase YjhB (NUDIX family)
MNRPKPDKHHPLPSNSKKVFHGIRWHVFQWEQEQFDGGFKTFESLKIFDSVVIYPVIEDKFVIITEEQPHWGQKHNSIVAGGVDEGEDVYDAAKRELLEETGMKFKDLYLVNIEQRSNDVHSYTYTFVAKNLESKGATQDTNGEKTEPREVGFEELIDLARKRDFFHKPSFIDEYIIQDKIDTLFDLFQNPEKYSIL